MEAATIEVCQGFGIICRTRRGRREEGSVERGGAGVRVIKRSMNVGRVTLQ